MLRRESNHKGTWCIHKKGLWCSEGYCTDCEIERTIKRIVKRKKKSLKIK